MNSIEFMGNVLFFTTTNVLAYRYTVDGEWLVPLPLFAFINALYVMSMYGR